MPKDFESSWYGRNSKDGGDVEVEKRIAAIQDLERNFPKGTGLILSRERILPTDEPSQKMYFACVKLDSNDGKIWSGAFKFFQPDSKLLALCSYSVYFVIKGDGEIIELSEGHSSLEYDIEVTKLDNFISDGKETWEIEDLLKIVDELVLEASSPVAETFEIPPEHPLKRKVGTTAMRVQQRPEANGFGSRR